MIYRNISFNMNPDDEAPTQLSFAKRWNPSLIHTLAQGAAILITIMIFMITIILISILTTIIISMILPVHLPLVGFRTERENRRLVPLCRRIQKLDDNIDHRKVLIMIMIMSWMIMLIIQIF